MDIGKYGRKGVVFHRGGYRGMRGHGCQELFLM